MPDPVVFGDLDSPTIRVRFFGGRSVQVVADEMPILPVTAPGLPPPGPSFVDFARTLGDPDPVRPKRGRAAPPSGPHLHALVRSAVYQTGTRVQAEFNGQVDAYEYQAGVLCDGDPRGDGYGPGRCRLVVVGKCLGPNEVRDGRPFTGPRSRDLWRAWDEAELPRPGAALPTFLTNLLRFAPPQAVVQSRLPSAWVADGLHLLRQELVRCRPEVVLVFGADALKALMGNKAKVGEYAGRSVPLVLDCRPTADHPPDDHHTRVVAVEHPASIVRDPDRYPQFLSGIKYAARLLGFGPAAAAAAVPLDYRPVYTTAELATAVAESERASAGGGYVSFDCEWEGRHPGEPGAYLYTVQWSHAPGHARVCFVRRQGGAPNPALPPDQAAPLLRRLFEAAPRRGARLVGHFAKADLPWLHSIGVDLYDHYVGPDDDPDPDGVDRLFGWQKTYFEGAFDTYVSQHAIDETAALKLEVMAATVLGVDRWDSAVIDWRAEYCKARGIRQSELAGYGNMTEEMVTRYGSCDVDFPGRLYLKFNGDPRTGTTGMLDADRFGQSSRQIFGHRMRAWAAWAEMERYGLLVDKDVHRDLRESLLARREELFAQFRAEVNWPDFDPAKTRHKVEFLFGEAFSPDQKPLRPPGALSLYLTPYKATKTFGGGRLWDDALYRAATHGDPDPVPAADKETLIILSRQHQLVAMLKDVETLRTALKLTFRPPVAPDEPAAGGDDDDDDFAAGLIDPDPVVEPDERYDKGLLAHLGADGRIRPMLRLVETGRLSSSPNLQNVSSSVDDTLNRILGWGAHAKDGTPERDREFVSRSIFKAQPGWLLVGADLKGAEIAMAGWYSGDPLLIDHARRSTLKKSDPDWIDLHSDLAARAFHLTCALKDVPKPQRTAAKRARFGHYYGASPETIHRKALEEDPTVTLEDVREIVAGHDKAYPTLAKFFAACRGRVSKPGWLCNGFGGRRRFRPVGDRDLLAKQEREAQNWSCQGGVADHMTVATGHARAELRRQGMRTRIVLSVHDSLLLEAPVAEVDWAVEVLHAAMVDLTPVVVTALDGTPVEGRGPYRFGIDVEVCRHWGVPIPEAEWRAAARAARGE